MTKENLETLKENAIPLRDCELRELTEIVIDSNQPIEKRIEKFLSDIGNPYYFKIDGIPVQIAFTNHDRTLDKALNSHLNCKNSNKSIFL